MADDTIKKLYKLSENPFSRRSNPDAPIVGRVAEQKAWTSVIESSVGQRGSSLNFIEGDYGLGKTHSLYHIKGLCEERGDTACVFMKLLMEDQVKNFGLDFGRRIFKNLSTETLTKLAKARATDIKRDHLHHYNVVLKYAQRLSPYVEVMSGGTVSPSEIRTAGIRRPPNSAEVMFEYLTILLVMLRSVEIKSLVLCVDEAEYIFSQLRASKAAWVFNAIRSLYDLPDSPNLGLEYAKIANLIFFFAMSTAGVGSLRRLEKVEKSQGGPIEPLLDRRNKTISLGFLSKSETRSLVKEYLHTSRVTGKRETDPLIPYDSEFVDYIYTITKGHPRHVIDRCSYVMEEGIQARVPVLTKQYAKEVLERLGLPTT